MSHCPHENVELRLRPPGIDLWTTHQPSNAEACLLFLVMGAGVVAWLGLAGCCGLAADVNRQRHACLTA